MGRKGKCNIPICRTGLESKEIKNNSTDPNSNELNNFRPGQTFPNFTNLINFITREQERIEEEQIQNAILESFQLPLETNETNETNETSETSETGETNETSETNETGETVEDE